MTHDTEPSRPVVVPQAWLDEMCLALDAATTIGKRSCRPDDHLHYANHDRLLRRARDNGWTSYYMKSLRTDT